MVRFAASRKPTRPIAASPASTRCKDIDFAIAARLDHRRDRPLRRRQVEPRPARSTGWRSRPRAASIVDGRDISALAGRDLRLAQRSIGMIFQHFNLLSSRTAADNVALPLEIAGWPKADIRRASPSCSTSSASPTSATATRPSSPAARSSASASPARWRRGRACCCRTRRPPRSTRRPRASILELLRSINRELGLTILLITHEMSVVAPARQAKSS